MSQPLEKAGERLGKQVPVQRKQRMQSEQYQRDDAKDAGVARNADAAVHIFAVQFLSSYGGKHDGRNSGVKPEAPTAAQQTQYGHDDA